ncbi:MAG: aspartate kinase, partial [Cellulophaga sp.]|nr:aspartate kinase [Cellulophaga sp.]
MRIFKFGGASVKDADGIKNVVEVLRQVGYENTLLVVSAMGKTTNAMETVVNTYFEDKKAVSGVIHDVLKYHNDILIDLFEHEKHSIFQTIKTLFDEVQGFLIWNKSPKYNFVYDQVIGYGELVSTTILSAYFNEIGIKNNWLDVREFIKTDDNYRDVAINWEKTQQNVNKIIDKKLLNITQGFIGSDDNNFMT